MKVTPLFFVFFLVGTSLSFSQSQLIFNQAKNSVPTTLFAIKSDTIVVPSIQMYGKIALNNMPNAYNTNLLPENYSWTADLRKAESLKNMALEIQAQDLDGRDLPINIYQEVIQRVYLSTPPNP